MPILNSTRANAGLELDRFGSGATLCRLDFGNRDLAQGMDYEILVRLNPGCDS